MFSIILNFQNSWQPYVTKVFYYSSGECISNAERFYNVLSNLLLKRGKKDFAIRINYRLDIFT